MDPFIGDVQCFAFNFAPQHWILCDGRLLSIASYQTLYSLLGTKFGGDGITTFGIPNLTGAARFNGYMKYYISNFGIYPSRS